MGKEELTQKILSDAEEEAAAIVSEAEKAARDVIDGAKERARREREETEAEVSARSRAIAEGKAAAARLDGAKILLAEKRRVLDTVYERALLRLLTLEERESLALIERLLKEYADEGDEVVFAADYPYATAAKKLDVVAKKRLKISPDRAMVRGGFVLHGKNSDVDLSFSALLAHDREENQPELAAEIFKTR